MIGRIEFAPDYVSRRRMIKLTALAGASTLVMGTSKCGAPKNLSFYVSTIVGALKDLSPLVPNLGDKIAKAITIAEAFDKAYRDGKFEDATAVFNNLVSVIEEITAAAGIDNDQIKLVLAVASIALRTIALLLLNQSEQPEVAAEIAKRSARGKSESAVIRRLANSAAVNKAYQASKL